jgi:hypothetical protein
MLFVALSVYDVFHSPRLVHRIGVKSIHYFFFILHAFATLHFMRTMSYRRFVKVKSLEQSRVLSSEIGHSI